MKRALLICMSAALLVPMLTGCRPAADTPEATEPSLTPAPIVSLTPAPTPSPTPTPLISDEERKRMDLYTAAMRDAFGRMNGGDGFIAIRLDTLEGLSDRAKAQALEAFRDLSDEVCALADIETDETRFYLYEKDGEQRIDGTKDGTVLSVWVHEYEDSRALITAISWFGGLAAVFPKYEASYQNGVWKLKCVGMPIS